MMPLHRARHTLARSSGVACNYTSENGCRPGGDSVKMLSVMSGGLCIKDCTRRSETILSADVTPQYTATLLAGLAAQSCPRATPAEFVKLRKPTTRFHMSPRREKAPCTCNFIRSRLQLKHVTCCKHLHLQFCPRIVHVNVGGVVRTEPQKCLQLISGRHSTFKISALMCMSGWDCWTLELGGAPS